jgi:hypothetical protein
LEALGSNIGMGLAIVTAGLVALVAYSKGFYDCQDKYKLVSCHDEMGH